MNPPDKKARAALSSKNIDRVKRRILAGKVDQVRRRKLLKSAIKRHDSSGQERFLQIAETFLENLTTVQRDFVTDFSPQKAALCTRRAGKTFACKIDLIYTALTQPDSVSVYINTSRRECRNIAWNGKYGLRSLIKGSGLKVRSSRGTTDWDVYFNATYLEVHFANGSVIRLVGVDDATEIEKLRGDAYDKVIVDEAAKFGELEYFFSDVISPALGDREGKIVLTGTPSVACSGYFWKVTTNQEGAEGWSTHCWTYRENIHLPHLPETYARLKERNRWGDDHPTWLREYCGQWVKATNLLVYSFNAIPEAERYYEELPQHTTKDGTTYALNWEYILGVDVGFRDAFSYSIWAYSDNCPVSYEIESYKQTELNSDEQADIIEALHKRFKFSKTVVDAGSSILATVEAWKERRGLPVEAANKTKKHAFIHSWNAAMERGQVKFRKGSPLANELAVLQWKEKTLNSPRPKEDKHNFPNDVCDAALYAWKELLTWAWEPLEISPSRGSRSFYKKEEELDEEHACNTVQGEEASDYYNLLAGS